jgi:S-DNA-T family DNA segregation ATPase FtsK/SpoIIIE
LSAALARLPGIPGWPLVAGAGGAFGALLLQAIVAAAGGVTGEGNAGAVAGVLAVSGLLSLLLGTALSPTDWRILLRTPHEACAAGRRAWLRLRGVAGRSVATLSRHGRSRPAAGEGQEEEGDFADDVATGGADDSRDGGAPGDALSDLVEARAERPRPGRKARREGGQGRLDFEQRPSHRPPGLDLLSPSPPPAGDALSRDALEANARMLKTVLDDFSVRGEIVKVRPGPVVTLYELEPAPGIKSSRVIGLADDIARSMSALAARVAVIPGRNVIGIELPNQRRETVSLRELMASDAFERFGGSLNLALGKDISGAPVIVDLARMPHLLIAGTTGSGKSVAINVMILSLLYRLSPDECKFILIDPKMLELSIYDGIPHLLAPVVTEPGKAVVALKWTVREMEERYRAMSQLGVRNVAGFNARIADAKRKGENLTRRVQTGYDDEGQPVVEEQELDLQPLPLIVVVVDEMADLMIVAGKEIETAVQRLSQMARAAGIHLIMATQRPSVDVITGTIKANFPTRVSFQVSSKFDSRTILGEQGAEQLLGQGDMLFMAAGGRVTRVHGPFVSDAEVEAVVRFLKSQGAPEYVAAVTEAPDDEGEAVVGEAEGEQDELYEEALDMVRREGKVSTSFIQRRLQIGYNRAARIVERMEREGVVSRADRVGRREVLGGEG